MMNRIQNSETATNDQDPAHRKNAMWMTLALGGMGLVTIVFYIFLAIQLRKGHLVIPIIVMLLFTIVSFIANRIARRNQVTLAVLMCIVAIAIAPILLAFFMQGVGLPVGLVAFLVITIIATQMLPQSLGLYAIAAGVIGAVLAGTVDYYVVRWQIFLPAVEQFTPWMLGVAILTFSAFVVRQFRSMLLASKLIIVLLVITLIVAAAVTGYTLTQMTFTLTSSAGGQLKSLADDNALGIGNYLDSQVQALTLLAGSQILEDAVVTVNDAYIGMDDASIQTEIDLRQEQWLAAMSAEEVDAPIIQNTLVGAAAVDLAKFHQASPANLDVYVTDRYGGLVAASKRIADYKSADQSWWQAAYNQGRGNFVYISPDNSEGDGNIPTLTLAVPVNDRLGNVIGVLRATYSFNAINGLLKTIGETGQSFLLFPTDPPQQLHQGIIAPAGADLLAGMTSIGTEEYTRYSFNEQERFVSATEVSASLSSPWVDSVGWHVIVSQNLEEMLAPVDDQIHLTTILVIVVAGVITIVAAAVAGVIAKPILSLTNVATRVSAGDLSARATVQSKDEVGHLADAFNSMTGQMQGLIGSLEERVTARTQDLELAAEVGRSASEVRDITVLLQESVDLIRRRFNLYHVQIYLVDKEQAQLVLRAGTGEAGRQLLADGHQLSLDASSLNGRAALEKETVLVADTTADPKFRPNRLLPNTVAEAAIPLLHGDRVVGVLDLQSADFESLNLESLPAFETLAGQLAVAIDNAALFAERQQAADALIPFRLGFERSPNAIFMTNIDGTITYVNQTFTEFYGYAAGEVLGQTPRVIKSGLIPQERYEYLWQSLLNKQSVAGEIVNKTKDGRLLHIAANNNPIVNDDGEIIGFLALHTDISDRKLAEDRLDRRVAELNCLNDIGRKVEEAPPIAEFLEWVTTRITPVFEQAHSFTAAVQVGEAVYGTADTIALRRQIVEGLYIGKELVGNLYFAYEDESLTFADEDSSFIGAIGGRISSYLESRRLLEQLEHQAKDLQQVAEIGTAVATILKPQELMQTFVDLTKSNFDLYHAHIYLLDEDTEILKLTAGAGDVGRKMVAERREIPLSKGQSLVAQAARDHEGVIVNDVQNEPGFLPHPLLPDTRSEMAVPLIVFNQLLGVLDVQSDQVDTFTSADVSIFTTLSTQVAVALQNANQYIETQQTVEEMSALQRAMTREGWQAYLTAKEKPVYGYIAEQLDIQPITKTEETGEVSSMPLQKVRGDETAVSTPVQFGETPIGAIGVRTSDNNALSEEQQELLQAISEQVGRALERARLSEQMQVALNETEARSEELGLLNEMSQQLTAQTNVDNVLDVAYQYTARMINTSEFFVAFYDSERDEVAFALTVAQGKTSRYSEIRKAGEGLIEYIVQSRQPLLMAQNVEEQMASLGINAIGNFGKSWMGVPLTISGKVIGVIGTQSDARQHVYSRQHVNLLVAIASQAAIAIENARLIEETTARAEEEQLLRQISDRVNTAVDAETILRRAAEEIGRTLGLEGSIVLEAESRDIAVKKAVNGNHK